MAVIRGKVIKACNGIDYNAVCLQSGEDKTQYVVSKSIDVDSYLGKVVEMFLDKNGEYVIKLPYVKEEN